MFFFEPHTAGDSSQPFTCWSILVSWRHIVCDSTMALTQPLSREGELQGVCWDCISLVRLITCSALLSASCNITWLMLIVCRSCTDFEDLKENVSVFVYFPHLPQIESEESSRKQKVLLCLCYNTLPNYAIDTEKFNCISIFLYHYTVEDQIILNSMICSYCKLCNTVYCHTGARTQLS